MFKINTEQELIQLLKVVSEEAVKKSRKTLSEAVDNAQERYMKAKEASEANFGVQLSEQEEDEASSKEGDEEVDTSEEPEEKEEQIDPETLGVSFDSVVKDINTLRSGRSTKDKEIKDELLGYYDRLDEDERKILHLFLSEISKILQGAIEAAEAQDPSDPPFNAEITFGEEEAEPTKSKPASTKEPTSAPAKAPSAEDTSPPIAVGQKGQNLNEIRIKVKRLMKRF